MKYKARLIDDGLWAGMSIDEMKEINEELELKTKTENLIRISTGVWIDTASDRSKVRYRRNKS